MPKITFDTYKETDEYKMWLHIESLCEQYELPVIITSFVKISEEFFGNHYGTEYLNSALC